MDHCLRSRDYVNVIVAGKQPALQYLDMDTAVKHCTAGIGIWEWASNDKGGEPDVVMGCAGDVPTLETLAAVQLLREYVPALKIRVVNVVDLMKLQDKNEHPHGLPDKHFDTFFTTDADHFRLSRHPVDSSVTIDGLIIRICTARLQGRKHDQYAVRHGLPERHGPASPGFRRYQRVAWDRRRPMRNRPSATSGSNTEYIRKHGRQPEICEWKWRKKSHGRARC